MKLEVGKRYVMRNGYITNAMQETGEENYAFKDGTLSWKASGEYSTTGAVSHLDIVAEYVEPQPQQPLRWVENYVPDKPGIWALLFKGEISVHDVNESEVKSGYLAHETRCYLGPIPEILPPKKKVVERLWIMRLGTSGWPATYDEQWVIDTHPDPEEGDWIRTDRTREVEQ